MLAGQTEPAEDTAVVSVSRGRIKASLQYRNREDTFLDGLLLPASPAGPGDSAVESVSWGRIKAALEID